MTQTQTQALTQTSTPTPQTALLQTVPLLLEHQCGGFAKFGPRSPVGLTSGASSGRRLVDVQLVHHVHTTDDIKATDTFLPGCERIIAGATGAGTDGKRSETWEPEKPSKRVVIGIPGSGVPVYEGPADLKKAQIKAGPKGAILTLFLRLRSVETSALKAMGDLLGEPVEYQIVSEAVNGALTTGPVDGGLPFGTGLVNSPTLGEIGIGDLVVAQTENGELVGLVAVITEGLLTIHQSFEGDPTTCKLEEVVAAHPLCGPRGGDPGAALKKMTEEGTPGELATPSYLLQALTEAMDAQEIERQATGWPLTDAVLDRVRYLVENDGPGDEAAGLPPEV